MSKATIQLFDYIRGNKRQPRGHKSTGIVVAAAVVAVVLKDGLTVNVIFNIYPDWHPSEASDLTTHN